MSNDVLKDFHKEARKRKFKKKVDEIKNKTCDFVRGHKQEILIYGPIIVGAGGTLIKFLGKRVNLKKQEDLKDLYCYDRSLGHYWRLRRELSNREWLEIDTRKKNGERLSDILDEMKVLK